MRIAVVGASVVASLVLAAVRGRAGAPGGFCPAHGARAPGGGGGLIALATSAGEHRQQVTVIDPETRVLGVYHIDCPPAKIVLKSVRNIHWDLQMDELQRHESAAARDPLSAGAEDKQTKQRRRPEHTAGRDAWTAQRSRASPETGSFRDGP